MRFLTINHKNNMWHFLYHKFIRPVIGLNIRNSIQQSYLASCYISFHNAGSLAEYVKGKLIYLFSPFLHKTEFHKLYVFMGRYGFSHLPYPFTLKYRSKDVEVYFDKDYQLYYVMHQGKRLFFPSEDMTMWLIKNGYNELNKEQDLASPHRYVNNAEELRGKTLLDIGAAEGIFALEVIEYVEKVYLFECDEKWIKPLEATFAPWKNKVKIIQKMVTDRDIDNEMSLYKLFEVEQLKNVFIKMDIEGNEQIVLNSSVDILAKRDDIRLAVCTYHLADDKEKIESLFVSLGYKYHFTNGYFYIDRQFRKAVIRAGK